MKQKGCFQIFMKIKSRNSFFTMQNNLLTIEFSCSILSLFPWILFSLILVNRPEHKIHLKETLNQYLLRFVPCQCNTSVFTQIVNSALVSKLTMFNNWKILRIFKGTLYIENKHYFGSKVESFCMSQWVLISFSQAERNTKSMRNWNFCLLKNLDYL